MDAYDKLYDYFFHTQADIQKTVVMNVKGDFFVLDYINLLLMLLCCMLPWVFAEKYNPDLLMYFGAKESILKQGLLKSIINNIGLFYLFL